MIADCGLIEGVMFSSYTWTGRKDLTTEWCLPACVCVTTAVRQSVSAAGVIISCKLLVRVDRALAWINQSRCVVGAGEEADTCE